MPDQRMTKEEGRAFKTRWRLVNELEIEELRQATPETHCPICWRKNRVQGMIIGGLAVSLLARPRVTRDVDAG